MIFTLHHLMDLDEKFVVLWVAGTRGIKYVANCDICNTDISTIINDIINQIKSGSKRPIEHFKLSMSSSLLLGIIRVHLQQVKLFQIELFNDSAMRSLRIKNKGLLSKPGNDDNETFLTPLNFSDFDIKELEQSEFVKGKNLDISVQDIESITMQEPDEMPILKESTFFGDEAILGARCDEVEETSLKDDEIQCDILSREVEKFDSSNKCDSEPKIIESPQSASNITNAEQLKRKQEFTDSDEDPKKKFAKVSKQPTDLDAIEVIPMQSEKHVSTKHGLESFQEASPPKRSKPADEASFENAEMIVENPTNSLEFSEQFVEVKRPRGRLLKDLSITDLIPQPKIRRRKNFFSYESRESGIIDGPHHTLSTQCAICKPVQKLFLNKFEANTWTDIEFYKNNELTNQRKSIRIHKPLHSDKKQPTDVEPPEQIRKEISDTEIKSPSINFASPSQSVHDSFEVPMLNLSHSSTSSEVALIRPPQTEEILMQKELSLKENQISPVPLPELENSSDRAKKERSLKEKQISSVRCLELETSTEHAQIEHSLKEKQTPPEVPLMELETIEHTQLIQTSDSINMNLPKMQCVATDSSTRALERLNFLKKHLNAVFAVLQNETLTISTLLPPAKTDRTTAATTIFDLLVLAKKKYVILIKDETLSLFGVKRGSRAIRTV